MISFVARKPNLRSQMDPDANYCTGRKSSTFWEFRCDVLAWEALRNSRTRARQGWIKRAWIAKLLLDNKLVARDATLGCGA